jgi:ABC-type antimicrobial peptide transport system permease subunit
MRIVKVVGMYQSTGFSPNLEAIWGTKDTAVGLSPVGQRQAAFYLKVDSSKLSKATDVIGQAVPNAFVLNLSALTDIINQFLTDILLVLTTIASLSLLAGVIIIANAVALAMLERRRELGILKSVGYTSRSILSEVLLENGVVSGTGALLAMLLVTLATSLLGTFLFKASFGVPTIIALGLVLGAAVLAMGVSALVAWGAVRVRPLEVLRYE